MVGFGNKTESLVKKNESILDVFTSTINKLEGVNTEADTEESILAVKAAEIESQRHQLRIIKTSNTKLASKLRGFLTEGDEEVS